MLQDSKMMLCKNNCYLNWSIKNILVIHGFKWKKTWIYLKNKSKEQCKINKSSCPYSIKYITRNTLRTLRANKKNDNDDDESLFSQIHP